MSEDKTKSSDNSGSNGADKPVEEEVVKETNKTYDQSEFDKEVARQVSEATAKFKGHEELKAKYDELEKWKKEKELSEMTDKEKSEALIEQLKKSHEEKENQIKALQLDVLRNNVLSEARFMGLPRAYKLMVQGESQEEIEANALKILEEYTNDFKAIGDKSGAPPPPLGKDDKLPLSPKTVAEKIKAQVAKKFKERNEGL